MMHKTLLTAAILIFLSCNERQDFEDLPQNGEAVRASQLVGDWGLEATRISPGGVVDWSVDQSGARLTFELDRSFVWDFNNGSQPWRGNFEVRDNRLLLTYRNGEGEEVERQYHLSLADPIFQINYVGCIESCTLQFRRLN